MGQRTAATNRHAALVDTAPVGNYVTDDQEIRDGRSHQVGNYLTLDTAGPPAAGRLRGRWPTRQGQVWDSDALLASLRHMAATGPLLAGAI